MELAPGGDPWAQGHESAVFQCQLCKNFSIAILPGYDRQALDGEDSFESPGTDWYPPKISRRDFPDVPSRIANGASEAYRCLGVQASNAAVAMARAVLEATAKDKKIASGSAQDKIEALATGGYIRRGLATAAHQVRWAGNDAMHGDLIEPISAEDAEDVLDIMSMVLREVYEDPATEQRIAANRAKRKADS